VIGMHGDPRHGAIAASVRFALHNGGLHFIMVYVVCAARAAKRLRPDFMCWVNGALLFKGEEKASEADLPLAVEELKGKISDTWAGGLLPGVQAPCMLAFAAAGPQLQVRLAGVVPFTVRSIWRLIYDSEARAGSNQHTRINIFLSIPSPRIPPSTPSSLCAVLLHQEVGVSG
jgi:hypothetical protein